MDETEYKRFTIWWKEGNNMGNWLNEAEKYRALEEEPGHDISTLKDQIKDNQEFMKEVEKYEKRVESLFNEGERLAVSEHLDKSDIEDVLKRKSLLEKRWSNLTQHLWERQNKLEAELLGLLQAEPSQWEEVWSWAGETNYKFLTILSTWQRFRKEQLRMLDWLEQKEKEIENVGDVDIRNNNRMSEDLEKLKIIESQLHEEAAQLQSLHNIGEDISKNLEQESVTANINSQLQDFDNCYNDITKRLIQKRHKLENAEAKLKEFSLESNAVTNWVERTEKVMKKYQQANHPNEVAKFELQLEAKRKERRSYQTRVDRVNTLAQDLKGDLDTNSYQLIESELQPINKRWIKSREQLEDLEQTREDHQQRQGSDCCIINIVRRKLRLFRS